MEQVRKVLILSTSHPYKTAGIVAHDIYTGFKKKGYITKLIVENFDAYPEKDVESIQNKWGYLYKKIRNKIARRLKLNKQNKGLRTLPEYHFDQEELSQQQYATKKILKKTGFIPDVIIVIFAQNFISYKNLAELQEITNAPIIWQFADMHPFTGGCHYAWDCKGYQKSCQDCPAIMDSRYKNITHTVLENHKKYRENLTIIPVIGSDWLLARARKSALFKDSRIEKIYLSLDTDTFKPVSEQKKQEIRKAHNLPEDAYVILIMAKFLTHKRKGIEIILKALSHFSEEEVVKKKLHLFIIGNELEKVIGNLGGKLPYTAINSVERSRLVDMYTMSDLFVSASLQEVGPYTITESLLCSVPVVSLDHGYANEFVFDMQTGMLVKDDEPKSLFLGIEKMVNVAPDKLKIIRENCREMTKRKITKEEQIEKYIQLINTL
ncbi:glycosyltransferase [Flavobacteriaceae bacterium F08102]|nr:glycosyltransferase [Flavobacteriaceae bacterium F08102]